MSLVGRVNHTLALIRERQHQGIRSIAFFSHGQFLNVLLDTLRFANNSATAEHMKLFCQRELQRPIANAHGFAARHHGLLEQVHDVSGWHVRRVSNAGMQTAHE